MITTKCRKGPNAMSFEEIGNLPTPDFEKALYTKLASETEPVLSTEFVEAIEKYVTHTAAQRRSALAYLSLPWPKITANIQQNRSAAVALANVYYALDGLANRYRELADYINAAEHRLMVALCTRKDSEAVMQEGRRDARP